MRNKIIRDTDNTYAGLPGAEADMFIEQVNEVKSATRLLAYGASNTGTVREFAYKDDMRLLGIR